MFWRKKKKKKFRGIMGFIQEARPEYLHEAKTGKAPIFWCLEGHEWLEANKDKLFPWFSEPLHSDDPDPIIGTDLEGGKIRRSFIDYIHNKEPQKWWWKNMSLLDKIIFRCLPWLSPFNKG
ncbi:MAG: hypothetical protein EHM79_00190 [Geobacter sp.]|nr:MAG: hypothetical protein EHM79_00190 [Geobacter sp.]